jgi:hypothetical protein
MLLLINSEHSVLAVRAIVCYCKVVPRCQEPYMAMLQYYEKPVNVEDKNLTSTEFR